MKLIQLECGVYAMDGTVKVREETIDTKIIDGKKYSNTEYKIVEYKTIDWLTKDSFDETIDISPFGDVHVYRDQSSLTTMFIDRFYPIKHSKSDNSYVNICIALFENNVFDNRIKNMFTQSKIHKPYIAEINSEGKEIDFPLFSYGFNNLFMCTVDLESFLFEIDINTLEFKNDLKNFFLRKYKIDLNKKVTTDDILKLLTKKINETN